MTCQSSVTNNNAGVLDQSVRIQEFGTHGTDIWSKTVPHHLVQPIGIQGQNIVI